jgi:deoxyribose-phosphate aldolase
MGDEAKEIEVVANTANIKDRKWEIIYHDDS